MPFEHLIGQDSVKKKLNFYLQGYQKTNTVPFLNFVGAKGLGKTEFAREFSKNLINSSGVRKPFYEINSSTIKNLGQFFEQIFLPLILEQEVSILFDEAHAIPRDLTMAFLTIFNTENSNRKEFIYKDSSYTFDFTKQSFFFATTESDKIFAPLRDRLVTIDFDLYNSNELGQIFLSHFPDISFDEEAINHLSTTFRGNARNCIHRVKDVRLFIETHNIIHFNLDCAKNLCSTLGILPEGLTSIEWRILNILRRDGRSSLQSLCAKTGLSRSSLQRDHENYLLSKGLMEIDGQRVITKRGNDLIYNNM